MGSTYDGSYEPVAETCRLLDELQQRTGIDVPVHVDGASGAMVAPFLDPDLEWDFRLPRVASISTSGHKYGLVYPGVGWVVWRDAAGAARGAHLLGQLPGRRHADLRPQLLAAGLADRDPVLQLPAARLRGLRQGAGLLARRRHLPLREDRRAAGRSSCSPRATSCPSSPSPWRADVKNFTRVRRRRRAARARLARAGLHVPQEPRGPGGAAHRRAARLHATTWPTCCWPTSSASFPACASRRRRSTTAAAASFHH